MVASIFLDFNLPNAATWFYFSLLLAVALFFKFSRFLSVRNWDVLTLFLLVPGLLLLREGRALLDDRVVKFGYLWLLCGSGYFLLRCLVDLVLVRRPALSPNLNLSGLAWLGGALFVCLVAVAARTPAGRQVPKASRALDEFESRTADLVNKETGAGEEAASMTSFWVGRALAILCHLAVVAALVFIGARHFQDAHAGMAAATFYLLLPYTAEHVGEWDHVWPAALLLWAVAAYRLPMLAGLLLGLAAGSVYFPVLLFPVWLSFYWRRGAGRFAIAFVLAGGLGLAVTALILGLDFSKWLPWSVPTTEGFWTGIHWAYRIPVCIAHLAFVLATAFWPSPKNLAHLLALSAAVLIGIQFWYADQGGVYVLWYLPLLLLLVFRPNLSEREAPPIQPEKDWLARFGRVLRRFGQRLSKLPEPPILRVR